MLIFCADSWSPWPMILSILGVVLVLAVALVLITLVGLLIYFIVRKEDFVIEEVTIVETEDEKKKPCEPENKEKE